MKKRIKVSWLSLVILLVFYLSTSALFSRQDEQQRIFRVKGKDYKVMTQMEFRENKSAILLYYEGSEKKLSEDIPGENIFPEVEVHGGNFYVSWINYKKGDERLCFYDSALDRSRVLVAGGFKFIAASPKIIFSGSLPAALIFKGDNSDNEDIFCYSFISGEIKNITNTPANEKIFRVFTKEKDCSAEIETETLYHICRYHIDPETLETRLIEKAEIIRKLPDRQKELSPLAMNKYITYGDSITWGKVRMNYMPIDPNNEYYHPELAYPQKIKEIFEAEYGEGVVDYHNLSNPGDDTFEGVARLNELEYYNAKFFLLMLGTNDAFTKVFALYSSLENLEYIVDTALGYQMDVIISTIPPRNDRYGYVERVKDNIAALNTGIINLAIEKDIKYIDTHSAFMNHDPPDGWKDMLEDRGKDPSKDPGGQHPSPAGHQVIAELFVPEILSAKPLSPKNITISSSSGGKIYIQWAQNHEFDFSHYNIMFGYFPDKLNRVVTSQSASFTFIRPPFPKPVQTRIYFCIQAVDDSDHKSDYSPIYAATF